ncbi:MAG: CinA family protein, partial [Clostridia bacterium]|nr:CinA family protein [Clostridia bacterium]
IQKEKKVFKFYVTSNYGDCKVDLLFEGNLPRKDINEIVRIIVERFNEIIYAEYDVTLGERLFDLLKLRRVKVATAESFTGGRIASEIVKNNGASEFLMEGIVCYSNQSKQKRLGVKTESLEKDGAVSARVAYEMALGLLTSGNVDLAISTTGIAGPTGETETKPVGLCYIGIGLKDGIHSYKLNLTGTREEITETAKNNALFLVIKKLKNL